MGNHDIDNQVDCIAVLFINCLDDDAGRFGNSLKQSYVSLKFALLRQTFLDGYFPF